jgi:hypothetical protein
VELVELSTERCSTTGGASVADLVELVELSTERCSTTGGASVVDLVELVELSTERCSSTVCAIRRADGNVSISARKTILSRIVE